MAGPDEAPARAETASRAHAREPRPWRARLWTWLLGTAAFVLVGWALHATAPATTLVVFSLFLTLMLVPVVEGVRARVPRKLGWLGESAAAGVLVVIALVFVGGLWIGAHQVLTAFPDMGGEIESMMGEDGDDGEGALEGRASPIANADGLSPAEDDEETSGSDGEGPAWLAALPDFKALGLDIAERIRAIAGGAATTVLNALTATLSGVIVVFFLTVLMLSEARDWRVRLSRILDRPERDEVFETAAVIGRQLRRYLVIRAAMGVITAALYAGWLWFSEVDLLLVWALLAFLLGFIPTLGAIISGILPVIYALLAKDFGTALLAGAGLLVIEQVTGNLIDPKLSGRYVSISPLVILVSLLIWSWIWGAPGLLLAAPMTIAIAVVCAHVPTLRPLALLMSNRRSMAEVDQTSTL